MTERATQTNSRLRVQFFLPNREEGESKAFTAVAAFLIALNPNTPLAVNGFSRFDQVAGNWMKQDSFEEDEVTILFVDYPLLEGFEALLDTTIRSVRAYAFQMYADYGYPQDEIWISTYPITCYTNA